jgi:hypothetical protein
MNSRQAAALQMEPNPLQKALDNYQELERQWHDAKLIADSLQATNASLLAEVGMLRELVRSTDVERARWQATAATLLGRLYAINDVVGGAVRAAVRDGLEATPPEEEVKEADVVTVATTQCAGASEPALTTPEPKAAPAPPQAAVGATIPMVDFGPPRQEFRR